MSFASDWEKGRSMYYDRQRRPITMGEWAELQNDQSYVVVGRHEVNSAEMVVLSTIWTGLNAHWDLIAIFESMVFGGPYDQSCIRYETEQDARRGHAQAMRDLSLGHAPWWERGLLFEDLPQLTEAEVIIDELTGELE